MNWCRENPGKLALIVVLAVSVGVGVAWLRQNVRLAWNETDSLAQSLFLVWLGELPRRGEYVLFRQPDGVGGRYPFMKRVAGVAGDRIELRGSVLFVANTRIGKVRNRSRRGMSLRAIAPGIIPPGHYFVHADHGDSYDSRYKGVGLVPRARITGRAVALY